MSGEELSNIYIGPDGKVVIKVPAVTIEGEPTVHGLLETFDGLIIDDVEIETGEAL